MEIGVKAWLVFWPKHLDIVEDTGLEPAAFRLRT